MIKASGEVPPKAGLWEGICRCLGWEWGAGNQRHLRAKFAIQIPVQLGMESAAVPKALGWTGITPTSPQMGYKDIQRGMKEGMILAVGYSRCGGTPATVSRASTAPDHPASSDFVVELYVGIASCLAAECWLYAISVTSCKGWEISALERGLEG